jgi:beta-glucosidase
MEHRRPPIFVESSGDACDSFHRYPLDLELLAKAGFNSYRFSIEWARLEPAPGEFSRAALDHYQRMIDGCAECGLTPMVTLHHFTNPRWTAEFGSWLSDDMVDAFRRYVDHVLPRLHGLEYVCTINEPNMTARYAQVIARGRQESSALPDRDIAERLVAAHRHAADLASAHDIAAGVTVAMMAYDCAADEEAESQLESLREVDEDIYLRAADGDAFFGVQAYTKQVVTASGILPLGHDATGPVERRTLTGWEFAPESVGACLRRAHEVMPDLPLVVTENGIATTDDAERVEYTTRALASVAAAMNDGVRVLGYIHWSLLDNFEWASGFGPTFGLVEVDRETFERRPKPSLAWLGRVASTNSLETTRSLTA